MSACLAGLLLSAAGLCWIVAFTLYVAEYGPVLVQKRRDRPE